MKTGLIHNVKKVRFSCSRDVFKESIWKSADLDMLAPVAIITYKVRK